MDKPKKKAVKSSKVKNDEVVKRIEALEGRMNSVFNLINTTIEQSNKINTLADELRKFLDNNVARIEESITQSKRNIIKSKACIDSMTEQLNTLAGDQTVAAGSIQQLVAANAANTDLASIISADVSLIYKELDIIKDVSGIKETVAKELAKELVNMAKNKKDNKNGPTNPKNT
jgi:hypothetical protein